jgi:hypothetical protein
MMAIGSTHLFHYKTKSDPEIAAGMQNPKVMQAFQDLMSGPGGPMGLMSNPAKLQEIMADPEVREFVLLYSAWFLPTRPCTQTTTCTCTRTNNNTIV